MGIVGVTGGREISRRMASDRASQEAFLGVSALLFAASTAVTIAVRFRKASQQATSRSAALQRNRNSRCGGGGVVARDGMEPGARPPIGRRLPGPFLQAQHIPLPANGSAEAMSVLFENLEDCRDSFLARPVPLEFDRIRQRADGDGARLHHTLDS